ncbi:MAG: prefoldin subunit beta [Candidatus Thermoplasmatota archaeon]|nr:prefoldin subunit beta [Candidatus Thermoplasmatota archaeon]
MSVKFEDLPPQVQNQLQQLQQFQQQLEITIQQRQQIKIRIKDIENALEELEKADKDALVFKNVGPILIKADEKDVAKELQDTKENLEVRKKTMEKQEQRVKEKIEEIQAKIQGALSPQTG